MPEEPHPFFQAETKLLVVLALLATLTYGVGIGGNDLWDPDEPRYAQVAREMVRSGDWVLPHLNGEVYHHKPPLYFWLVAAATKLTGGEVDSVSARLPAVTMGFVCILLTYLIGKLLWNRAAGFLGACAFATCVLTVSLARTAHIDTTLTALTTLAIYAFARNALAPRPQFGWDLTFFVSCGLGVLAKGPVAIGIPIGTAVFYSTVAGNKRAVTARHVGDTLLGVFLMLAIPLAWFVPACIRGGNEYANTVVFKQIIQRVSDPEGHVRPFHYFFVQFPWCSFPWFFLFCAGVWHLIVDTKREDRRPVVLLFVWIVFVFAMFTASASKRATYLLPLLPAVALIVGKLVADRGFRPSTESLPKRLSIPLLATGLVLAAAGAALVGFGIAGRSLLARQDVGAEVLDAYDRLRQPVTWISTGLFGLGLIVVLGVAYRRPAVAFGATVLSVAGLSAAAGLWILPGLDALKSAREISFKLQALLRRGDQVAMYDMDHEGIFFYLDRRVLLFDKNQTDDLVDLTKGEATTYVLVEPKDYERWLAVRADLRLELVESDSVGHRRIEVYKALR